MCEISINLENENPGDFLMPQWQLKEHKSVNYLCYRLIIFLFYLFSVVVSLFDSTFGQGPDIKVYYIYMSHWSLVATTLRMLLGASLVVFYYATSVPKKMTFMLKVYWFSILTTNAYAFMVTLLYWGLPNDDFVKIVDLNNILAHITNSGALIIEFLIVRHPGRFLHFVYTLPFGFVYVLFTLIFFLAGGHNE